MNEEEEEFTGVHDRTPTHGISGKVTWIQRANALPHTTTHIKVKQYSETMPGDRT